MTNFEKIKNMSVAEFFEFLGHENLAVADISRLIIRLCDCGDCPAIEENCKGSSCMTTVSKWLKKEVQEDESNL